MWPSMKLFSDRGLTLEGTQQLIVLLSKSTDAGTSTPCPGKRHLRLFWACTEQPSHVVLTITVSVVISSDQICYALSCFVQALDSFCRHSLTQGCMVREAVRIPMAETGAILGTGHLGRWVPKRSSSCLLPRASAGVLSLLCPVLGLSYGSAALWMHTHMAHANVQKPPKTILFACVHNAGRSQMACAWLKALADPQTVRSISAGTAPGERVHPEVREVMREDGIDLSRIQPHQLTSDFAKDAHLMITMGCGALRP